MDTAMGYVRTTECVICGAAVPRDRRRLCSDACARDSQRAAARRAPSVVRRIRETAARPPVTVKCRRRGCDVTWEERRLSFPRYCSHECRKLALAEPPDAKICSACRREFTPSRTKGAKKYCSAECRRTVHNLKATLSMRSLWDRRKRTNGTCLNGCGRPRRKLQGRDEVSPFCTRTCAFLWAMREGAKRLEGHEKEEER